MNEQLKELIEIVMALEIFLLDPYSITIDLDFLAELYNNGYAVNFKINAAGSATIRSNDLLEVL